MRKVMRLSSKYCGFKHESGQILQALQEPPQPTSTSSRKEACRRAPESSSHGASSERLGTSAGELGDVTAGEVFNNASSRSMEIKISTASVQEVGAMEEGLAVLEKFGAQEIKSVHATLLLLRNHLDLYPGAKEQDAHLQDISLRIHGFFYEAMCTSSSFVELAFGMLGKRRLFTTGSLLN